MVVGGCDVGSTTGKAVILNETEVLSSFITPSTTKPEVTARSAMDEAVQRAGLSSLDELDYIVGTGLHLELCPRGRQRCCCLDSVDCEDLLGSRRIERR